MTEKEHIEINGSFIPVVDGKILCMPQGGPIRYAKEFEAIYHARQYKRGWTGYAHPADIDDVI